MLMAALLLDLFEKITYSEPRNNKSWTSHVDGAIALVKLRGFELFQGPFEFSILVRLSTHYIVGCVASGVPVPDILNAIQAYIGKHLSAQDPMVRLCNLMVQYANLRSKVRRGVLSNDECIGFSMELDGKIQALDLELPPSWQYSTTFLDHPSDRIFGLHFDSYSNPRVCQARNILRVIRILLNESLIAFYLTSSASENYMSLSGLAHDNIEILASEICACVPQYVDCDEAARQRLPSSERLNLNRGLGRLGHPHTPTHELECYTLIFPLYVAGRSKAVPRPFQTLSRGSSHNYIT